MALSLRNSCPHPGPLPEGEGGERERRHGHRAFPNLGSILYESDPARLSGSALNWQPARSPKGNDTPSLQPVRNGEREHSVDRLLLPSPSGRRAGDEGKSF